MLLLTQYLFSTKGDSRTMGLGVLITQRPPRPGRIYVIILYILTHAHTEEVF